MTNKKYECIDAGTNYCPCYLAEAGECITCSHLQNLSFCECEWRGVCIYQEYVISGYKSKSSRNTIEGRILSKVKISDKGFILKIQISKTMARNLEKPGSFLFLRNPEKGEYFNVPMSIMLSDPMNGIIYTAVRVVGIKTKAIKDLNNTILVRGPYWNGILGQKHIDNTYNEKCLVILRGINQGPGVLLVKKLVEQENKLKILIDPGRINKVFITDYLNSKSIDINTTIDIFSSRGKAIIEDEILNSDLHLIYSGGSDKQHRVILDLLENNNSKSNLMISNNREFCCGEGVCGSCSVKLPKEEPVKLCKVQMDIKKLLRGV